MREAAQVLLNTWRRHGHDIGFGVGISQGYATLGQIGFAERMDYTAIGTVTNLAARLCGSQGWTDPDQPPSRERGRRYRKAGRDR